MEAAPVGTDITNHIMISSRKSNTGIYSLVSIWFIRESIMDELPLGDVHRFQLAVVIGLSKKEKLRYTNPLKVVIPDRMWFEKMLEDGYTLTIVTPHLDRILDPNKSMNKMRTATMSLIATKNERIIPLNNELMPASVFCMKFEQEPWFSDKIVKHYEPDSRIVNIERDRIKVEIMTPMLSRSTWLPMFVSAITYGPVINDYDGNKYSKAEGSRAVIQYLNMSKSGYKRGFSKPRKVDRMSSNTVPETNLFAIMSAIDYQDEYSFPGSYNSLTVVFDVKM